MERAASVAEAVERLRPTQLNTEESALHTLEVKKDKLSVKYTGKGSHSHDVGAIQANHPLPAGELVGYFELEVVEAAMGCRVAIGLASKKFTLNRQPGWEPESWGYHGDDGRKYHNSGQGDPYGPVFSRDDVVGVGIVYHRQQIFFTKNGKFLKAAFEDVGPLVLYPTIGLHSPGEMVTVNFGQKPFRFDLESFAQEERDQISRTLATIPVPVAGVHAIVRDYLLHYGFRDTLATFDRSMLADGAAQPGPANEAEKSLDLRRELHCLVMGGQIDAALTRAQAAYPRLLALHPHLDFLFQCQLFIELVRAGNVDAAVEFAQTKLGAMRAQHGSDTLLLDSIALLAYQDPAQSPVSYLLRDSQRLQLADELNNAIVCLGDGRHHSVLEEALRHLQVTQWAMREWLSAGRGESFVVSCDP